jgi:hypothetical protein
MFEDKARSLPKSGAAERTKYFHLDEAMEEQQDLEVASKEQTSQLQVPRLLQEGLDSRLPSMPAK